jgi:hypothetical protein
VKDSTQARKTSSGKGGQDPSQRYKLIAQIAQRDKRFDHTEFDLKTLQLIWDNGPHLQPSKASTPSENQYKEVSKI